MPVERRTNINFGDGVDGSDCASPSKDNDGKCEWRGQPYPWLNAERTGGRRPVLSPPSTKMEMVGIGEHVARYRRGAAAFRFREGGLLVWATA